MAQGHPLNEGHSAFAILEWARLKKRPAADPPCPGITGESTVFTTHTPVGQTTTVPGGLAEEHLEPLAEGLGLPIQEVLGLGRIHPGSADEPFLPTVLALKLARRANAPPPRAVSGHVAPLAGAAERLRAHRARNQQVHLRPGAGTRRHL
jgi:glucan phosphorylase